MPPSHTQQGYKNHSAKCLIHTLYLLNKNGYSQLFVVVVEKISCVCTFPKGRSRMLATTGKDSDTDVVAGFPGLTFVTYTYKRRESAGQGRWTTLNAGPVARGSGKGATCTVLAWARQDGSRRTGLGPARGLMLSPVLASRAGPAPDLLQTLVSNQPGESNDPENGGRAGL